MEKTIKVFIQGETDWLIYDYNQTLIDGLYSENLDRNLTAGTLGMLLDGDPIKPLAKEQRERIGGIVAKYVANLTTYQLAKQLDQPTIFITSFRSSKPKKVGYLTRVAGIRASNTPNASPESNESVYLAFLQSLNTNPLYSIDRYDSNSMFHEINEKATLLASRLQENE